MAVYVLSDLYIVWHILPSCGYLKGGGKLESDHDKVTNMIKDAYFEMTMYPIISSMVTTQFGPDIALIILDYFKCIDLEREPIEEPIKGADSKEFEGLMRIN